MTRQRITITPMYQARHVRGLQAMLDAPKCVKFGDPCAWCGEQVDVRSQVIVDKVRRHVMHTACAAAAQESS